MTIPAVGADRGVLTNIQKHFFFINFSFEKASNRMYYIRYSGRRSSGRRVGNVVEAPGEKAEELFFID